jgi:hypothetical protein
MGKTQFGVVAAMLVVLVGITAYGVFRPAVAVATTKTTWEYTIVAVPDAEFDESMKALGLEGWELVFARRASGPGEKMLYEAIFKRVQTVQPDAKPADATPKPKSTVEDAVAKMEGFQKAMCGCSDKNCADKVNEEMTVWGTEMAKAAGAAKDEKPSPTLARKSAEIMTKYTECMTKIMMAR